MYTNEAYIYVKVVLLFEQDSCLIKDLYSRTI